MKKPMKGRYVHRNVFIGVATVIFAVNLLLSAWGHTALDGTLRYVVNFLSNDMLKVQAAVVKQWHRGETEMVKSWVGAEKVEQSTLAIQENMVKGTPPKELVANRHYKLLDSLLDAATEEVAYVDYFIASRDGTVLLAKDPLFVGTHVAPVTVSWIALTAENKPVLPNVVFKEQVYQQNPAETTNAVIPIIIPIKHQGEYVATLFAMVPTEIEFNQLFEIMGLGYDFDIFAFNAQGLLVTNSRRFTQLKDKGLLLNNELNSTVLNAQLRVPDTSQHEMQPLTYLAAESLNAKKLQGINLNGYTDFTGNEVLGAWLWLETVDIGIAIELDQAAADKLMQPLRLVQLVIFVFLCLTLITILGIIYYNLKLKDKVDQIEELGQYKLIDKIGEGGMGEVFFAKHAMLLRPTAIKLLKTDADTEIMQRFEKEVRLTSRLSHPNTVEVYDYGLTQSGRFYYAMEYIEGFNLAEILEISKSIPAARVIYILKQICGSLKEAHSNGIVHRDIKPMNVMLNCRAGAYDQIKVLDFGLVKLFEDDQNDLTSTQVLRGSPSYIAPERLVNARCADPSVDIYAVAAIGYNLLTGDDLYSGTTQMEIMSKAMSEMPPMIDSTIDNPIPEELIALLMRNLAKDPAKRDDSMQALIESLQIIEDKLRWTQSQAKTWWEDNQQHLTYRDNEFTQES